MYCITLEPHGYIGSSICLVEYFSDFSALTAAGSLVLGQNQECLGGECCLPSALCG